MPATVTLSYSEAGEGTPVVLLHGFPLSSAIWYETQQQLSDHYRVITPDLRGHGRSPAPTGVYEMDLLASDVLALLDSLNIKKAAVLGHSMGGYVTLAAWRRAPERFLALGLIASQAVADISKVRQGRYLLAEKVVDHGSHVVAEAMLPKLFATNLNGNAPAFVEQVRKLILDTPTRGIVGCLQGMASRPDFSPMLAGVKIPVLVLNGEKDQIILPENAAALASAVPQATVATIENAGHLPMLEQLEATTTAIRKFLGAIGAH